MQSVQLKIPINLIQFLLSNPVNDSLGFISKHGDYDISKFRGLIVDNSFSEKLKVIS